MTPKPQDPHGIAKLAAEQLLSNMAEVHGIELVVAVPHNIVGPRQKYDDPYRNVASIMINSCSKGVSPSFMAMESKQGVFLILEMILAVC